MTPGGADIIVALATPPGPGALGVVRLSGPGSRTVAGSFLRPPGPWPPRRARLAWAYDEDRPLDQVLATYFPAGASYTGEESVEVSAHGSPFVLERLLALCRRAGARPALPGEFTQRAFLNGRLDLAQAEAVCDLIAARTRQAHRAAVAQLEGGLSRRLGDLRARLVDLAAWVEASLDHPDEDIPLLPPEEAAARLGALREGLGRLLQGRARGRLAREGARIAIVGRPNAGKSSLLNALLGRDRAIVSESAGTTRDALEESADLGNLQAVLIDTAGLRPDAGDPVEREGQSRARSAARSAHLALALLDRTEPPEAHRSLLEEVAGLGVPWLPVLNKKDLPARTKPDDIGGGPLEISAATGDGVEELVLRVKEAVVPGAEDAAPAVSERHAQALAEAAAELEAGAGSGVDELLAHHLRGAIRALDRISGRDAGEDVLSEIFSRFCVGK